MQAGVVLRVLRTRLEACRDSEAFSRSLRLSLRPTMQARDASSASWPSRCVVSVPCINAPAHRPPGAGRTWSRPVARLTAGLDLSTGKALTTRNLLLHHHCAFASAVQEEQEPETSLPPPSPPLPTYCSGCGVKLQQEEPDAPGYFKLPRKLFEPAKLVESAQDGLSEEIEPADEAAVRPAEDAAAGESPSPPAEPSTSGRSEADAAWSAYDSLFDDDEGWEGTEQRRRRQGPWYEADPDGPAEDDSPVVLCARCFSLQNYGRVKSQKAELSMPAFDLGRKVGRKMALQKYRRPVVACVVDVADFDGSLPRAALRTLLPSSMLGLGRGEQRARARAPQPTAWNAGGKGGAEECRLVLIANKCDLLPPQATKSRLEGWIRQRAQQAGLPRPDSVHLISSTKQTGVFGLLGDLQKLAGPAGDVWVVGAQNAGKSSLINAMRRCAGKTAAGKDVTTAAVPGTTLGLLRIDGILGARRRMFDTPGVPHQHQLSSRLTADEVRLLLPRGRLKPRTFRAAAGQTVLVGGVLRIDVLRSSAATLYLTVWASADIACHFGKTEGAGDRHTKLAGTALNPPLGGASRLSQLGPLLPADIDVGGDTFKASTKDVAIAGLGWVGVGLSGTATLRAWTHEGVASTVRDALVPDLATVLEKPGLGNKTLQPPRVVKRKG